MRRLTWPVGQRNGGFVRIGRDKFLPYSQSVWAPRTGDGIFIPILFTKDLPAELQKEANNEVNL